MVPRDVPSTDQRLLLSDSDNGAAPLNFECAYMHPNSTSRRLEGYVEPLLWTVLHLTLASYDVP